MAGQGPAHPQPPGLHHTRERDPHRCGGRVLPVAEDFPHAPGQVPGGVVDGDGLAVRAVAEGAGGGHAGWAAHLAASAPPPVPHLARGHGQRDVRDAIHAHVPLRVHQVVGGWPLMEGPEAHPGARP